MALLSTASLRPWPTTAVLTITTLGLGLSLLIRSLRTSKPSIIPGPIPPSSTLTTHPYPPTILPGHRRQPTPHGTIHIYEFGPPTGEKVLFLPGIGTPCLALGGMATALAEQGYRVCLFDFWGRGWSDGPDPARTEYGMGLYAAQVFMVLGGSEVAGGWLGEDGKGGFHLVGYSLGGGLAVGFARYWPGVVRSVVCVCGGGLIRREGHVGWAGRALYEWSDGLVPRAWREWVVGRRIRPRRREGEVGVAGEVVRPDGEGQRREREKDSDASGGNGFDSAPLLSRREDGGRWTVADVMEWQIREHRGFIGAFMSTIRHAPIYDCVEDWEALGEHLRVSRTAEGDGMPGLKRGKILLVMGSVDSVIVKEELLEDAAKVLGEDGFEVVEIDGGHEAAFTHGEEIADAMVRFWKG